jgi:hypothetical protein
VEWIHLAQDGDQWQALVNAVMNLQVPVPWSWLVMVYIIKVKHVSELPEADTVCSPKPKIIMNYIIL